VKDSFDLLEERVDRAVARLRELLTETGALKARLQAETARAEKAERALAASGERLARAEAAQRAAQDRAEKADAAVRHAEARARKAEAVAAERTRSGSVDEGRVSSAEQALEALRREREDVRARLRRLVETLASLE
jgi:hypothetical protein